MLPLAGSTLPTSASDLASALEGGLRQIGFTPRKLEAKDGGWPKVEHLSIDLTGAVADRHTRIRELKERGPGEVQIASGEIVAAPAYFEKVPFQLNARLRGATAHFLKGNGEQALALSKAEGGEANLEVAHADLEAGIHAMAEELAAKQGVNIKSTKLELSAPTPRSLVFRLAVTAKVFIMSTTVNVRGRVELDDQLNARVSDLVAQGEGMMAAMVESVVRPRLAQIEQQSFAIGTFVAAGLRMHDVEISVGQTIRLHAKFAA